MKIPTAEIFSEGDRAEIAGAFRQSFRPSLLPGERFTARGELEAERLIVEIEMAVPDRTTVTSFFGGVELSKDDKTTLLEHRALLVQFIASMIEEHLREGRWPRPHLEWKEYIFEGKPVFYKGSGRNEALETEADRLLAEADGE
jgi:hypothetical protein